MSESDEAQASRAVEAPRLADEEKSGRLWFRD